jgi:ATP synthase protein I
MSRKRGTAKPSSSSHDRSAPGDAVIRARRKTKRVAPVSRWSDWKGLGSYGTVGLEVVLSVMLGLFAGRWLDGKLGSAPYLALVGGALGVGTAARAVLRAYREMQHQTADDGWRESQADRPARFALDEQEAARRPPDERAASGRDRSAPRDEHADEPD